jgi:DNA-binding NarL/FixJ family response regulator
LLYVRCAEEALKTLRGSSVDAWVVNTDLPGLSGYELCAMLRARSPRSAICLVADRYTPDAERAAWAARATLFLVRPAGQEWIEALIGKLTAPQPTATDRTAR